MKEIEAGVLDAAKCVDMLEFPKKSKIEGMPIEDVAWGHEIYLNVKEKGIGQQLKVWDHHMS